MFSFITLAPTQSSLPFCFRLYCLKSFAWTVEMYIVTKLLILSISHQISFMQASISSWLGVGSSPSFHPGTLVSFRIGWGGSYVKNIIWMDVLPVDAFYKPLKEKAMTSKQLYKSSCSFVFAMRKLVVLEFVSQPNQLPGDDMQM